MAVSLNVQDVTTDGRVTNTFVVDFLSERITVRDLIRSRVYQEVKDYNAKRAGVFRGLVEPTEVEETLNGPREAKKKMVDWKKQFDRAIEAFQHNGFVVLVDDRQAESLDMEVDLQAGTQVSFLKLVRLVGG